MMKRAGILALCTLSLSACSLQLKPSLNPFYNVVLKEKPSHAAALYGQGETLIRQGRYDWALRYFTKLTQTAPGEAQGWLGLGQCHFELHDFKAARESFQKSVILAPSREAQLGLATSTLMAGQITETEALAEQFQAKYGATAEYYRLQGDIAYLKEDWTKAMTAYRQSLKMLPAQPDLQNRAKDLQEFLTAGR